MISENELEGYERVVSDRLYDGTYIKRIVLKLVAEVRKMNKKYALLLEQGREDQEHVVDLQLEADWLAAMLHLKGYVPEGTVIDWTKEGVRKAWREAARKEVKGA